MSTVSFNVNKVILCILAYNNDLMDFLHGENKSFYESERKYKEKPSKFNSMFNFIRLNQNISN